MSDWLKDLEGARAELAEWHEAARQARQAESEGRAERDDANSVASATANAQAEVSPAAQSDVTSDAAKSSDERFREGEIPTSLRALGDVFIVGHGNSVPERLKQEGYISDYRWVRGPGKSRARLRVVLGPLATEDHRQKLRQHREKRPRKRDT